jgi:hypothetical protein
LLWGVGAVPNNHPGLLAFLAAEILRGRKVIIFPEGGMNKERRIAAAPALPFLETLRPQYVHRNGAAALAVVLEIFKKHNLNIISIVSPSYKVDGKRVAAIRIETHSYEELVRELEKAGYPVLSINKWSPP